MTFSFQRVNMEESLLKLILRIDHTVFSFRELLLLSGTANVNALKSKINYYVRNGDLYHIRRGLYAKDKHYDRFELATRIYTPAYVSFETILTRAGFVFQYYSAIFVASYQSREIICDGQTYIFKRIKPTILLQSPGVRNNQATPERAFLDTVYLHKKYYFDSLDALDWHKVYAMAPLYGQKSMKKAVDRYYKIWTESLLPEDIPNKHPREGNDDN